MAQVGTSYYHSRAYLSKCVAWPTPTACYMSHPWPWGTLDGWDVGNLLLELGLGIDHQGPGQQQQQHHPHFGPVWVTLQAHAKHTRVD